MFIGLCQYKSKGLRGYAQLREDSDKKIVVMDTKDCTAELVEAHDIISLDIKNFGKYLNGYNIQQLSCLPYLYVCSRIRQYVQASPANNHKSYFVRVGSEVYTIDYKNKILSINNNYLFTCFETPQLIYLFKFRQYIVFRFCDNYKLGSNFEYIWYSVVVHNGEVVAYWDELYKLVKNSALAMQIDTLSEV